MESILGPLKSLKIRALVAGANFFQILKDRFTSFNLEDLSDEDMSTHRLQRLLGYSNVEYFHNNRQSSAFGVLDFGSCLGA